MGKGVNVGGVSICYAFLLSVGGCGEGECLVICTAVTSKWITGGARVALQLRWCGTFLTEPRGACLLAPVAVLGVLEELVVPGYRALCDPEAE